MALPGVDNCHHAEDQNQRNQEYGRLHRSTVFGTVEIGFLLLWVITFTPARPPAIAERLSARSLASRFSSQTGAPQAAGRRRKGIATTSLERLFVGRRKRQQQTAVRGHEQTLGQARKNGLVLCAELDKANPGRIALRL